MLGINLLLWTLRPTAADRPLFEVVKGMGYGLVEVPVLALDEAECRAVGRICDELGLARTALAARGAEDNPLSDDPGIRRLAAEHGRADLDKAAALGATQLIGPIHAPFCVFTGAAPTKEEWRRGCDHMAEMADAARARGITLSIEVLQRFECYVLNTTADGARFVKDVGADNLGMLYDTFHANIEDPNIGPTLSKHAGAINHVHLSENHRGTLGTGMIRWDETFAALRDIGYGGHLVIEVFSPSVQAVVPLLHLWRKTFDSEEAAARDSLAFVSARLGDRRKAA